MRKKKSRFARTYTSLLRVSCPSVMAAFSDIPLDKASIISTVIEGVLYGEIAERVLQFLRD